MTGEKNRYSSVEKLWKFDDETLKTPRHDEMVIWFLNTANAVSIIPELDKFLSQTRVATSINSAITRIYQNSFTNFWVCLKEGNELTDQELMAIAEQYPFRKKFREVQGDRDVLHNTIKEEIGIEFGEAKTKCEGDVIWVLDGPHETYTNPHLGKCVAYIYKIDKSEIQQRWKDLVSEYRNGMISLERRGFYTRSEIPIMTKKDFLVGYWDIVISFADPQKETENFIFEWQQDKHPYKIYVEVKPKIESFGVTLRQLRTYQEYEEDSIGNTYLFTDDLRFKDAFESQGIHVITRQSEEDAR